MLNKLLLFILLATYASCWTFIMVDDRDMVNTCDKIIEGTIQSKGPSYLSGMPATDYIVLIDEIIKEGDTVSESTITVTVPGGFDPNNSSVQLIVPGAPNFEVGDKALLFLVKHRGRYVLHHFALGAYFQAKNGEKSYAIRSIDDRTKTGQVRDFNMFKEWVHGVVKSSSRNNVAPALTPKNYYTTAEVSHDFSSRFNLFTYQGNYVRWFDFDNGGSVTWQTYGTQSDSTGNGMNEIDNAMSQWNGIGDTQINYVRSGTTDSTNGLTTVDQTNSIVFGDPTDYIPGSFSCSAGGTLAQGGYWTYGETATFRGTTFAKIVYGDVVVQDGIECWLQGASDADSALSALLTHELGHTLGLRHSCGDSETGDCTPGSLPDLAIMKAFVSDSRGPVPNQDDVEGITYLYSPTGQSGTTGTTPATPGTTTGSSGLPPIFNFSSASNLAPFSFFITLLIVYLL